MQDCGGLMDGLRMGEAPEVLNGCASWGGEGSEEQACKLLDCLARTTHPDMVSI